MSSIGIEGEQALRDKQRREEIREVLIELLDSPIDLPDRFRGWLPGHVASSGIQVPVSHVVGNFLVENSTGRLGTSLHGRIGMVRNGSAPYDFFQLAYDGGYGKWVSDFFVLMSQLQTFTHTGDTAYAENTQTQDFVLPYESFDAAGITPQFRLMGQLDNSNGGATSTATVLMGTFDANEAINAATEPSWSIANTGTSEAFKDTGWQDIPVMAVKDFLIGAAVLKTSSGAATASVTGLTLLARWVSV